MNGYAEFDTVESAREWRRELQGYSVALFRYTRSRSDLIPQELSISTDIVGARRLSVTIPTTLMVSDSQSL